MQELHPTIGKPDALMQQLQHFCQSTPMTQSIRLCSQMSVELYLTTEMYTNEIETLIMNYKIIILNIDLDFTVNVAES